MASRSCVVIALIVCQLGANQTFSQHQASCENYATLSCASERSFKLFKSCWLEEVRECFKNRSSYDHRDDGLCSKTINSHTVRLCFGGVCQYVRYKVPTLVCW